VLPEPRRARGSQLKRDSLGAPNGDMLMTSRLTSRLSIVLAALLPGCGHSYAIWIAPNTTASSLAFGVASKPHGSQVEALSWLQVETCEVIDSTWGYHKRKAVWSVMGWTLPDSTRMIRSVVYGQAPPGFEEPLPAPPLGPGCFVTRVSAWDDDAGAVGGEVYFWIDADLAVRPWSRAQFDSADVAFQHSAAESKANSDSVFAKCRQAYKAAKTALDTAAVEKAVWGDTIRFQGVSCGEYRGAYWHWTGKNM
jgi:hypothetical protein